MKLVIVFIVFTVLATSNVFASAICINPLTTANNHFRMGIVDARCGLAKRSYSEESVLSMCYKRGYQETMSLVRQGMIIKSSLEDQSSFDRKAFLQGYEEGYNFFTIGLVTEYSSSKPFLAGFEFGTREASLNLQNGTHSNQTCQDTFDDGFDAVISSQPGYGSCLQRAVWIKDYYLAME